MRPPILSKYPVDKIINNFKSSKDKEMWIVRFIPQLLNKQKINANAISVMKRISLLSSYYMYRQFLAQCTYRAFKLCTLLILQEVALGHPCQITKLYSK